MQNALILAIALVFGAVFPELAFSSSDRGDHSEKKRSRRSEPSQNHHVAYVHVGCDEDHDAHMVVFAGNRPQKHTNFLRQVTLVGHEGQTTTYTSLGERPVVGSPRTRDCAGLKRQAGFDVAAVEYHMPWSVHLGVTHYTAHPEGDPGRVRRRAGGTHAGPTPTTEIVVMPEECAQCFLEDETAKCVTSSETEMRCVPKR
jgi:hypothetical protein